MKLNEIKKLRRKTDDVEDVEFAVAGKKLDQEPEQEPKKVTASTAAKFYQKTGEFKPGIGSLIKAKA